MEPSPPSDQVKHDPDACSGGKQSQSDANGHMDMDMDMELDGEVEVGKIDQDNLPLRYAIPKHEVEDTKPESDGRHNRSCHSERNADRSSVERDHRDRHDYRNESKTNLTKKDTNEEYKIIQVLNIAPWTTQEQLTTLFSYLGDITDMSIYDIEQSTDFTIKVCFIEFARPYSVLMAQHLTNTFFIDRILVILPCSERTIPDKNSVVDKMDSFIKYVTKFNPGVHSQVITSSNGTQVISTSDSRLVAMGLTAYPNLPNADPTRVEEIRRTLYIGNLDSSVQPNQVMKFFNDIDEVKYVRLAGDETQATRFAFVEYTHQSSLADALLQNGYVLGSRSLKINHSNNAIVKPTTRHDTDDNSKRSRGDSPDRLYSSRYRDRDRDRYRERRSRGSRSHKSRSRSRDHRRSISRDRSSIRRRSRSRDKAPSRKRSRSRDSKRRRSRSRSTDVSKGKSRRERDARRHR